MDSKWRQESPQRWAFNVQIAALKKIYIGNPMSWHMIQQREVISPAWQPSSILGLG